MTEVLNFQLYNTMEQLRNAGFAITICDKDGKILDMNARSKQTFAKYGDIIGHSLFEYHPPRAAEILRGLLENHNVNAYTIEKEGLHKLIYQVPWRYRCTGSGMHPYRAGRSRWWDVRSSERNRRHRCRCRCCQR